MPKKSRPKPALVSPRAPIVRVGRTSIGELTVYENPRGKPNEPPRPGDDVFLVELEALRYQNSHVQRAVKANEQDIKASERAFKAGQKKLKAELATAKREQRTLDRKIGQLAKALGPTPQVRRSDPKFRA